MTAPLELLRQAFDPEAFRHDGHLLVDRLASYLAAALRGDASLPVLPWREPAAAAEAWASSFRGVPDEARGQLLQDLLARFVAESQHLHHPGFVGHQVNPPLPAAALADLAASLLNQSMAIYELSPAATSMERAVVRFMTDALGLADNADGVLTNGGTAGNLTALLAARQATAGRDVWREGTGDGPQLAVLASSQAHYSVARAVKIMGWGEGGLVPVDVDEDYRVNRENLEKALARAEGAGRRVVAVVANAGSTATGAFDPLDEVADVAEAHGLWLHVDGAHGASAVLSQKYRHLVRGVERADSVVWDAHKLMLQPSLVTAVLYRDGDRTYEAFAQHASYLFGDDPREEWYNLGSRTLECTKQAGALKLYLTLALYGPRLIDAHVTTVFDLARRLGAMLAEADDFELAAEPQANIVCWRHVPKGIEGPALDAHQAAVRRHLVREGRFYLVQTRLPTGVHLRSTVQNPFTTERDLEELLRQIRLAPRG